jgi:hypothetical protein
MLQFTEPANYLQWWTTQIIARKHDVDISNDFGPDMNFIAQGAHPLGVHYERCRRGQRGWCCFYP